jgi:trk system potassium uptake protein TrkH
MGACAGSTGGGIKVVRYVILFKAIKNEIASDIQPRSVKAVTMDGKPLDKDIIRGVLVFIGAYATVFAISLLIIAANGFDIVTNFTAVVACLSNIGPGLEVVGPAGNFSQFSDLSKFVLIFDMLAGRLEIFPMLILLSPRMWKKFK